MKVKSVSFQKLFPTGQFSHEKLGVEIELEENENPDEAMQKARRFVDFNHQVNGIVRSIEQCEEIINNPDHHTGREISDAKSRKQELKSQIQQGQNLLSA